MTSQSAKIRDWMFRTITFEADSEKFRSAGIRIGTDQHEFERDLLLEALDDFPIENRNRSLRMSRLYATIYCLENSVRDLIKERLELEFKSDWWQTGVPKKVREFAEYKKSKSMANTWLEGDDAELISFTTFGHLSNIIIENWDLFSDLIPTQHWLHQRFDELEQARNYVAHNRFLMQSEFERLEMYVRDWKRQVGV